MNPITENPLFREPVQNGWHPNHSITFNEDIENAPNTAIRNVTPVGRRRNHDAKIAATNDRPSYRDSMSSNVWIV
jgi:hypothetical protein